MAAILARRLAGLTTCTAFGVMLVVGQDNLYYSHMLWNLTAALLWFSLVMDNRYAKPEKN